jgi:hypothetical protein
MKTYIVNKWQSLKQWLKADTSATASHDNAPQASGMSEQELDESIPF